MCVGLYLRVPAKPDTVYGKLKKLTLKEILRLLCRHKAVCIGHDCTGVKLQLVDCLVAACDMY